MFRPIVGLALLPPLLSLWWFGEKPAHELATRQLANSDNSPTSYELKTTGEMLPNADWFDFLVRGSRRGGESMQRPDWVARDSNSYRPTQAGTYKTLCVRLCDGFSFPISYSTRRERFSQDAKRCEQTCPSRSRLFIQRRPSEDADDSVDLDGRPYRRLPNAFLHRTKYVTDCTCGGNPWDKAAASRHRAYAQAVKQSATTKTAEQTPVPAKAELRTARRERLARGGQEFRREEDDDRD